MICVRDSLSSGRSWERRGSPHEMRAESLMRSRGRREDWKKDIIKK